MALITKMASDLTGVIAPESEFVQLIVRKHAKVADARVLDVLATELDKLKSLDDLVVCEVKAGSKTREIVMTLAEFRKLVPDKTVQAARKTRGRRPGFRPSAKS